MEVVEHDWAEIADRAPTGRIAYLMTDGEVVHAWVAPRMAGVVVEEVKRRIRSFEEDGPDVLWYRRSDRTSWQVWIRRASPEEQSALDLIDDAMPGETQA